MPRALKRFQVLLGVKSAFVSAPGLCAGGGGVNPSEQTKGHLCFVSKRDSQDFAVVIGSVIRVGFNLDWPLWS